MDRRKFILFSSIVPFLCAGEDYSQKLPVIRFSPKKESPTELNTEQLETVKIKKALDDISNEPLEDIIKEIFGDITPFYKSINVILPQHSSNSSHVPVTIKSSLDAKRVALFANPDNLDMQLIAKWEIPDGGIVDYFLYFRLVTPAYEYGVNELKKIKVILEDRNGNFYMGIGVTRIAVSGPEY